MAEEIVAKYRVDVTEASKNLTDLANTAKKTEDAMAKSAKAATDSFIAGSNGAKRLDAELAKQPKTLAEMELKLRNLKELLRDDTKIGTEGFKQVTKAIKETEAAIDKANGKLEETKSQGTGLIGTFKNLAVTLGVAFGVQQIIAFGKEAVQLAAKAEGVERAFKRIGSSTLLDGLRQATRNTVTDLNLMTTAVQASNFKIPLENLAKYMEFASARARETGVSVDYLVESILQGVGRGSIEVWDNMGISISDVRSRLNGVSIESLTVAERAKLMSEIVTEELGKMGKQADTTADRLAQLSTVFDNLLTKGGESLVKLGTGLAYLLDLLPDVDAKAIALTKSLESFKDMRIQDLASGYRSIDEIVGEMLKKQFDSNKLQERRIELEERLVEISTGSRASAVIQEQKDIRERLVAIDEMIKRYGGEAKALSEIVKLEEKRIKSNKNTNPEVKNVFYLTEQIKALNEQINAQETAESKILPLIKWRTMLQAELTKLTTEQATGTALLNQQLSELKKELDSAEIGGSKFWATLDKITDKTKELWEAQAMMKFNDDTIDLDPEMWQLPIDKELDALYKANQEKLRMNKELNAETKAINDKAFDEAIARIEAEISAKKEQKEKELMIAEEFGQYAMQLSSLISQAQQVATENELAVLQSALDAGQITREEYDAKRRELLNDQAKQDKEINIFEATIAAFLATIKAYSDGGPIAAAIAAAFGIAQVALIAAQPIPQFAEGGWVDSKGKIHGRKHAQGGVKIETEGDEFIVKGVMANRHPDIVEAVNQGTIMKLIKDSYVTPAVNAALLNGFSDIGTSAQLNGLTAKLSDHNIIAAMDRNRSATVYGLKMLAEKMDKRQPKRGGYA